MTDPITPERLAEIEARADAATEGPWEAPPSERVELYHTPDPNELADCMCQTDNSEWEFVSRTPEGHVHLWHEEHQINGPDGKPITGNYDYEDGGVLLREDRDFIAHARTDVPALLVEVRRLQAAVERVRELHGPFRIYGECECEDTTTPGHVDIDEVGITCNLLYVACRECCTSGVDIRYQTEDCADGHDHRDAYCPTIAALDGDEQ